MGMSYGTPIEIGPDGDVSAALAAAEEKAIERHAHYYTDVAGWLFRAEANRYAYVVHADYDEWGTTAPRLELFAFPVVRFTTCGATILDVWDNRRQRFVNLTNGDKQYASRSARDAVHWLIERRSRAAWVLSKKLQRVKDDKRVAEVLLNRKPATARLKEMNDGN